MKLIEINNIEQKENELRFSLTIDGHDEKVTAVVSDNIARYLTSDRIDPIVCGLLLFAVKNGYDFKSEFPISEELKYNIRHQFIKVVSAKAGLHAPAIDAPIVAEYEVEGKIIGTGISCGVDSLYTISEHTTGLPDSLRLSHLFFFNVGAHHTGRRDEVSRKLYEGRRDLCRRFTEDAGLHFAEIAFDLPRILDKYDNGYSHAENHTYMDMACVNCISSGMHRYYYSSGLSFGEFDCNYKPDTGFDCAKYDLLILTALSHGHMKLISSGGDTSRLDKIKALCEYPLAYRYLNVCVCDVENDGTCFKCMRTLLELDALGKVELFSDAFDISKYKKQRRRILEHMYVESKKADVFMLELLPYFKSELTHTFKIKALFRKSISVFNNRIIKKLKL